MKYFSVFILMFSITAGSALAQAPDFRYVAAQRRPTLTPRGAAAASTGAYEKTADLGKARFLPGLTYWIGRKRIKPAEAAAARQAPIHEQVAMVLEWEKKGIYFSTDKSKSI